MEVAHYGPIPLKSIQDSDGDSNYSVTVLQILESFGLGEGAKSLYGGRINGLHNVITMTGKLCTTYFDCFQLWLELVLGQEITYDICASSFFPQTLAGLLLPYPPRVTFNVNPKSAAAMGQELQLPDPVPFTLRAPCSRVANLSGIAEQIYQILDDREDMTILATNGSMAELLSRRLMSTSRAVDVSA
ncbi:hypothetical protein J132_08169 [Termitomyces sp. J132]|nr:hypothetical protein H2248_002006 [Termitomyces sp. 'cryptogamus']KNZ78944.1 hypothetical protein J132_08169 [Termitomyces sp. J132]